MSAGGGYTCALLDNHSVKCWGDNVSGQLGLGDSNARGDKPADMGDALPAVSLGKGRKALALNPGGYDHTCALLDDHSVKCWGMNHCRELGIGDSTSRGRLPADMGDALPRAGHGSGRSALVVAAGDEFTCAVLDDHTVKCWGYNVAGQLGVGDETYRGDQPGEMGDALPVVDLGTGHSVLVP